MKSVFFAAAVAVFVCGSVFGDEPVSVLNHGAPTPAAAAVVAAPAAAAPAAAQISSPTPTTIREIVVVDARPSRPIVIMGNTPRRCVNGKCATKSSSVCTGPNCQKYRVDETESETVRKRWFGGGVVVRNNNRTVVKPVR